jgi:hypothetical protein
MPLLARSTFAVLLPQDKYASCRGVKRMEWTVSESEKKRRNAPEKSSEERRLSGLPNSLWISLQLPGSADLQMPSEQSPTNTTFWAPTS